METKNRQLWMVIMNNNQKDFFISLWMHWHNFSLPYWGSNGVRLPVWWSQVQSRKGEARQGCQHTCCRSLTHCREVLPLWGEGERNVGHKSYLIWKEYCDTKQFEKTPALWSRLLMKTTAIQSSLFNETPALWSRLYSMTVTVWQ